MTHTCCVSIDVDPVPCYYRIHGLGPAPSELRTRILCASLPRFARVFAERDIRATFFIVGEDIDIDALGEQARDMRAAVREVHEAGHELASHSYSHPYELATLDAKRVADEIVQAHDLLSELAGSAIVGFRSPGYDLSPDILRTLVELEYLYDSSVFPAPGYYAAKAIVMAALGAMGRKSGAVVTNPRALLAPIDPYEPDLDQFWQRGASGLLELPIAVTRRTRTPVIGTNLLLAPRLLRRHWISSMAEREFFNLELHGIDLCGAEEEQLPPELVARQPDLRVPLRRKLESLGEVLDQVRDQGFRFATLAEFVSAR